MFAGFTPQTSEFLWGLMFHNERPWFQEHREEFLQVLKLPLDQLAEDTRKAMAGRYPREEFRCHVSRIYRDARRLHGRGPYKDHLWFSLYQGDEDGAPCFWFEIGAASYGFGLGWYSAAPAQMEAYRRAIDAQPARMERLARDFQDQGTFRLAGEDYRRPRGSRGALLDPWYNKKWLSLECSRDFGGALLGPGLPEELAEGFSFLMPYYEFLRGLPPASAGPESPRADGGDGAAPDGGPKQKEKRGMWDERRENG